MDALTKNIFAGKWKSFKLFKRNGDIKLGSEQSYMEFNFAKNDILTIRTYKGGVSIIIAQTEQWILELIDKKHYLKISSYNLVYEVITVNHTILVVLDTNSYDKIFLTREMHWNNLLKSHTALLL